MMTNLCSASTMAAGFVVLGSVLNGCTESLPAAQEVEDRDVARIRVMIGEEDQSTVSPGTEMSLPVVVDMSDAEPLNLASLAFEITWNPDCLTFLFSEAGEFGFVTINDNQVAEGKLIANLFAADGTTEGFQALSFVLESGSEKGTTTVELEVTTAGDELGNDILPNLSSRDHEVVISK